MPCPATQCTQGDGKSDPASKGGAEKMAEMAQKLMEMLQKKGGGGGGAPPPPGEEKEKEDPNAFDNVLGSIFGATSTATSTEDRTQQILDSIGENFGDSAITTEVRAIAEEIAGTAVSVTAINDIATSGSTSTATTGSGKNNIVGSTAPFTPPQSQSSASKNNNGITGSSVFGNSGVGAFFGVISNAVESAAQASARFVTQVCTNRPWDNTIVSTVFTTGFFDNLCVSRGYAPPPPRATKNTTDTAGGVGRASISCPRSGSRGAPFTITWACPTGRQSGGIGFTTNGLNSGAAVVSATSTREYVLECSDGTKDRCTVEVGVPKTDLTASPAFVQLGGRSRLYWTSEGVQSCELTGVGMRQEGLTGAAMSPSIYDRSTFTVTCRTADGETVKDTTIVDIGL
ncbi:MAG: hypothetical protein KBE09_00775 [Candidatus Pacebacteria bacterium]|nr:hypothetical protein [Candidatus Paceibacterota bacterium]